MKHGEINICARRAPYSHHIRDVFLTVHASEQRARIWPSAKLRHRVLRRHPSPVFGASALAMASVLSRLHRLSPFVSPLDRPARPRAYNSLRVHATNAHSTRQRTRVPLSRRSRPSRATPPSGSNVEKSDGTFISDIDGYYGDNIRTTKRSEESRQNGMKTRKDSEDA